MVSRFSFSSVKKYLICALLSLMWACSMLWMPKLYALPADIETDRLLLAVETALEQQDWDKANARLIAIQALNDHLPPEYFYYRGRVSTEQEDYKSAQEALERYLSMAGKEGTYYRQSLQMLNRIEDQQQAARKEKVKASMASQLVLDDGEHKAYIKTLQELYLIDDGRDALELHINTLLSNHRYIPGRYRSDRKWLGSLYQIQVHRGQITVLEKRANQQGGYSLNQQHLPVYGVNPYLSSHCDSVGDQCWLKHPDTGRQWLEIEADREAVESLADAFSHLLRYMQGS